MLNFRQGFDSPVTIDTPLPLSISLELIGNPRSRIQNNRGLEETVITNITGRERGIQYRELEVAAKYQSLNWKHSYKFHKSTSTTWYYVDSKAAVFANTVNGLQWMQLLIYEFPVAFREEFSNKQIFELFYLLQNAK